MTFYNIGDDTYERLSFTQAPQKVCNHKDHSIIYTTILKKVKDSFERQLYCPICKNQMTKREKSEQSTKIANCIVNKSIAKPTQEDKENLILTKMNSLALVQKV